MTIPALVTVRTRTRGKSAKTFEYQAIGKTSEYEPTDKDGWPIRVDGQPTQFVETETEEDGKVVKTKAVAEGQEFIKLDRLESDGAITSETVAKEYLATFANDKRNAAQLAIDAMIAYGNELARSAASPVAEEKEDELGPLVRLLVINGILISSPEKKQDGVSLWRRNVTVGSKAVDEPILDFVEMTKEVKKLRKLQADGKAKE
jgi:hypothetical protein